MITLRIDTEDQQLWVSVTGEDGLEDYDCISLRELAEALRPYLEAK